MAWQDDDYMKLFIVKLSLDNHAINIHGLQF